MFGIGSVIKAVAALAIVGIVAGGLWYVTNLKADLAVSQQNEQLLVDSMKEQTALLESMKKDIAAIQKANDELRKENEQQRKDVNALASKFLKRDFGEFALQSPQKAQQLIDRGVKNALRCLEIASGDPLTQEELDAKTPIEANRECPALIISNRPTTP
jgi:hypothetical protein